MSLRGSIEASILTTWVIYERPTDYPRKWVVRAHDTHANGVIVPRKQCHLADSLAEARTKVPLGLYRIVRHPEDEPQIVETWI